MKREGSLMPMSFLSPSYWTSTCWTWKVEQELAALSICILREVPKGKKGNTVRVIEVEMTRLPWLQEDCPMLCVLPTQL